MAAIIPANQRHGRKRPPPDQRAIQPQTRPARAERRDEKSGSGGREGLRGLNGLKRILFRNN